MKNTGVLSETLSDILFASSQEGLLLLDSKGLILNYNEKAKQLLGDDLEKEIQINDLISRLDLKPNKPSEMDGKQTVVRLGSDHKKVSIRIHFDKSTNTHLLFLDDFGLSQELEHTKYLLDEAEDLARTGSFELNLNTFKNKGSKGIRKLLGLKSMENESDFGSFLEWVHSDDRESEETILMEFKQGLKYKQWERRIVRNDGQERIFQSRVKMITDEEGVPEKIIGVSMDVTDLRLAEIMQLESLIRAQEESRQSLAREIHDALGPMISGSKLYFERIANKLDKTILPGYVENLEVLAEVHKGLRNLSHRLVPKSLIDFGLAAGIETLCDKLEENSHLEINFTMKGNVAQLHEDFDLNLYRIAQELTHNVIKHARASTLAVQMIGTANQIEMIVKDNGIGIEANTKDKEGIGLLNVKARVKMMKGKLLIDSTPNIGTIIKIEVPL
jgi:signal transduction histidine kinase